jgi:hypothetical protein
VTESRQSPVVTALALVVLLALIGGAGYVIYLGARDAPSVFGALVTALGAVLAVVAGRVYETRRASEEARRNRMAPIYERLMETINAIGRDAASAEEMQRFFEDLSKTVLIWGPPSVVKAFVTWRRELAQHEDPRELVLALERLLYALRADLGVKSGDLAPGDLARVWINDFDDFAS